MAPGSRRDGYEPSMRDRVRALMAPATVGVGSAALSGTARAADTGDTGGRSHHDGVLVTLDGGSQWTVTGTSYLSRLTLSADSAVTAPAGSTVSMAVDGEPTAIEPGGDYSGAITIGVG